MAKRFFDTKLHRKPWFRALRWQLREAFRFHCAECDEIGIWEIDMEALNFSLALSPHDEPVTVEEMVKAFDFQIVEGDKLWSPYAVAFQFGDEAGEISEDNSLLPKILRMLKARGLPPPKIKASKKTKKNPPPTHPEPTPPPPAGGVKEEEKEKEEEIKKGGAGENRTRAVRGERLTREDWLELAKAWPHRDGVSVGVSRLLDRYKTREEFDLVANALDGFLRRCAHKKTEIGFIPHFSTWVGTAKGEPWRDTIDWRPTGAPRITAAAAPPPAGGMRYDASVTPGADVDPRDTMTDEERRARMEEIRGKLSIAGGPKAGAS